MSDEYEVGYGKPPKSAQFQKGQSGNPKGRPRGSKNFKTIAKAELFEKVIVRENGKSYSMTKIEAVFKALGVMSMKGDLRAIMAFVGIAERYLPEPEHSEQESPLNEDQNDNLKAYVAQQIEIEKWKEENDG